MNAKARHRRALANGHCLFKYSNHLNLYVKVLAREYDTLPSRLWTIQ